MAVTSRQGLIVEYRTKRTLDLLVAVPAVVVLSPVMLVIALLIAWRIGRPVLFRQIRPGLYGHPFTMYKFRTMLDAYDDAGVLLSDEVRLTRFGRWLRSSSLDELPELFNVLRGDMSIVGPRPLLMRYLERYTPEQKRRHEVNPGITGCAQVHGRNALSWDAKFEHDLWYVEHCSLAVDIRIILLTIWKVVRREGINSEGWATMPEFSGREEESR